MTTERDIAREFDQWADAGRGEEMAEGHGDATRQALDLASLANARFLDVGCGTGWTLDLARDRGASFVAGVDLAAAMLRRGRATGCDNLLCASAGNLPFADATFDVILSVEALYYTIDLDAALRGIHRLVRPHGRFFCVVDLYTESPACDAWVRALSVPVHALSIAEWEDALRRAGFRNVESQLLSDARPRVPEADFQPSQWFPTWQSYHGFKELGSLLLLGSA